MTEPGMRLDPVTAWVRSQPGDYLLIREAAVELGISTERLKALGRRYPDTLGPGYVGFMGQVRVYLYDQDDIDAVRAWFAEQDANRPKGLRDPMRGGRGRPPMWTQREHASRHRRRALAHYHRVTAEQFAEQGREEKAEQSRARAARLQRALDEQRERRVARLQSSPHVDAAERAAG